MANYTLLLLWVTVMVFKPFHAVPLRNHGGVSYGEDFLRILDPRARSSTASATTLSQTHKNLTSSSQDSESEQSASTTSSASVTNIRQNGNNPKLKSSALRALQAESLNNFTRRKSTTTSSNNSSTTTPRTKRFQLSTPTNRVLDKHQVAGAGFSSSRADASYPYLYDDYDYYYYLDDLPIKYKDELKNNSNHVRDETNNAPTNNSTSIMAASSDAPQSREITSKPEQLSLTTSNPTTKITMVTARHTRSRKELLTKSSSTSRPPVTSKPQFRYQALTEGSTTLDPGEISTVTTQRALTNHTVEKESKHINKTDEADTTSTHSSSSNTQLPVIRNPSNNIQSQTIPHHLPEDAVVAPTSVSAATSRPSIPVLQDRHQRPKIQRNSPSRFRYTTPSPKQQRENRNISTVQKTKTENTLEKSLGSSSSSSVVVEVRVESPRPEARRMPVTKTPPVLQALDSDVIKGTPFPPRTVHTVDPDHHTTSFLLSDSLVVDLVSGPRTSNQQPERRTQKQHRASSTRVQSRTTTSTPGSVTPEALPLQQNEEKQHPDRSVKISNSTSDGTQLPEITSDADTAEPTVVKMEPEINAKDNVEQNNVKLATENTTTAVQTQSQSVSTSVSRTVVHTAEEISSKNIPKPSAENSTTTVKPPTIATASSNLTNVSNETLLSNTTRQPRAKSPQGFHPQGLLPFGEAPEGLSPFGIAPEGLAPHGLKPSGLHPHGLSPYGYGLNNSRNATAVNKGAGLTLVDATVAEGGADANNSVGYVAVEHNISRFRHEEKTPDGFIVGEYGEVDHVTGDVNGVRYIAVDNADPNLIYDSLIKFLNL